ncbi:unnamed protein product [Rangifer tarandus platyrhynchus]|uniref:Uncharacterized protein n=1 Tax=Rangifer tarandus platyrhynchus TaxID=3082113 RepID=A0AC59ZV76_RANTA
MHVGCFPRAKFLHIIRVGLTLTGPRSHLEGLSFIKPTLEWSFPPSQGSLWARSEVMSLSRVRLFETPWTIADQAPPSMEFSRQEYWSGLPFPPPGDLPNPGIEPESPTLQADALILSQQGSPLWAW